MTFEEEFVYHDPHLVVMACAGTGKTCTVTNGVRGMFNQKLPSWYKPTEEQWAIHSEMMKAEWPGATHLTSFSTDAADQLAEGMPDGATSSSTYSMGLRCAKEHGMARKLDMGKPSWKYGRILSEYFSVVGFTEEQRWKGMRQDMLDLIAKAQLELFREMNEEQLVSLADHYGVEIPYRSRELFLGAMNYMLWKGLEQVDEFNYTDMVWIPPLLGLVQKKYEHLIVDEYQDMGKAQQEICYRIARKIIAIGDPHQAIYGFIGADANATQNFLKALGCWQRGVKQLPLTLTRRCPKSVVELANTVLETGLKALPEAPDGTVKYLKSFEFDPMKLEKTDMVICPTNAPLISLMFKLNKAGVKAFVRKTDVVDKMARFINNYAEKGMAPLRMAIDEQLDINSSKQGKYAAINIDKFTCLKEICQECHTPSAAVRSLNSMFVDDEVPGTIRLSTVHRAKGLEAKRVIFWEYDRAGKMAKLDWERKQVKNLMYVAITRSKDTLLMVHS